jgi:hypothetical protein
LAVIARLPVGPPTPLYAVRAVNVYVPFKIAPPVGVGAAAATSVAVTVGPSFTKLLQAGEDPEESDEQAPRPRSAAATRERGNM